ncbi:hypothetical protein VTN77DRAFT_4679 [Rasamsonia byssochlamydoides]|uniref:uncharacterized protein n=1 Tax=Rasamsonia byssochlamydoides TaxID=89139 RepID=UPI003741F5AF
MKAPIIAILLLSSLARAWQYVFTQEESLDCHESCFTTDVGAFETVRSPIWLSTSPLDSFERSKMSAVNGSAWEQWYFETVSESGGAAFAMSFSRDPSYRSFGYGVLRMELVFAWENGTRTTVTDFVEHSRVQDCCGVVQGRWTGKDRSYSFLISADLKQATIMINTPRVKGSVVLHAFGPARYPDGSLRPSRTASTEVCPYLHFTEPITAAKAHVDFSVDGSPLSFSGFGGQNHFWAAYDWFTVVEGWHQIRGTAGPYAFTVWNPVSKFDAGVPYHSALLVENGETIFTAHHRGPAAADETTDHIVLSKTYDGHVHSSTGDASTGWVLEFVSPSLGKRWKFTTEHQNLVFEMDLGNGTGLAAFTDVIRGGESGQDLHSGYSICEQVLLPEKLGLGLMLKIWWAHVTLTKASILGSLWRTVYATLQLAILG